MKQVTASGQTVSYGYDALGRRTSRTDNAGTTSFQYDGLEVVADRAGSTTIDYLNGPGVDEKLRQSGGSGGTFYFLQDHLNSVIGLVGTVNERHQYEAFGANGGSGATRYGFTGRERDAATGLMYYRARWYDAGQGRFLTEDPIGFAGGDANLYSYVSNSPLNLIDPLGLFDVDWGAAAGGAAVGFASSAAIGAGLAAVAPVFPIAAPLLAGAFLGIGLDALYMTIKCWDLMSDSDKSAFLGGLFGGWRGGKLGGAFGSRGATPQARCPGCKIPDSCFVAGTKVKTPEGEKKIEEIRAGDEVFSSDPEQGEQGGGVKVQKVVQVFERTVSEVVDIRVGGETITATPEHPFWVVGRGWIAAGQLERGSPLMTKDGRVVRVDSITRREGEFKVYNFEVASSRTYFVSGFGVLVHNQCGPSFLGQANGPAIPIPQGATQTPIVNPGGKVTGFGYTGGNGGNGLSPRVTGVRVMDPTLPKGPSPGYPNGYVNYMNSSGQAVNPYTGKTIGKSDPMWHIPLN